MGLASSDVEEANHTAHSPFVTAYDEYAVRAFEMNAVDYLLKPVERSRLRATLNRAQERIEHAEIVEEQTNRVGHRDRGVTS